MVDTSIFDTFPELKTERLILRDIRLTDVKAIFEMRSNNRVNQFIPRPEMLEHEAAKQLVEKTITAYNNRQAIAWAGILRNSNEIIGTCGFNQIDIPNLSAEIGGELSTDFWGKKIALEAVRAIIKFGFEKIKLHSIEAKVSPNNRSAIFLLESLGFAKEAHYTDRIFFNGKFSDMAVYTLIKGNENFS